MKQKGIQWIYLIVPIAVFYIYILTLSPQIFWRDAPEFVATSHTLSISHPSGSPTYNLFAKTFTFLPVASVTFRVHMASAVCGAAVVLIMLLTMKELFTILYQKDPTVLQRWGMAICAIMFGISISFWKFSVTAEVYTVQDLLFLIVLCLGLIFYRNGDIRLFFAGAFLFGLSMGAHIVSALFLPPFLLLYLSRGSSWKLFGTAVFFFLLGFSVYLYLPFRFERAPLVLGYKINNLDHTISHMTGKLVIGDVKQGVLQTTMRMELLGTQAWIFFRNLVTQLSLLGVALGIYGLFVLFKRNIFIALVTIVAFLLYWGFFIHWELAFGFFPNYILWTIWMAVGLCELIKLVESLRWQKAY